MQHLEVSGAVRHIYIYVIRRLKVNGSKDILCGLLSYHSMCSDIYQTTRCHAHIDVYN